MTDPISLYEEWFVPALFAPLARATLAEATIAPGARVLDVACGSGVVARQAARRVGPTGTVTGLDLNPAMLAAAARVAAAEGLAIDWREGDAQALPIAAGAFDLVVCQMGVQFFPDRSRAVAEMRRVLAPGGEAIANAWRDLRHNPFFAAWTETVARLTGSAALGGPFSFGEPEQLHALFADASFAAVRVRPVTIEADFGPPEGYVERQINASAAALPDLQRMAPRERDALIAAIGEAMAPTIQAHTIAGRVRALVVGSIVHARRE